MNKCPRCKNENLKEEYRYCPICGALIDREMAGATVEILKGMMTLYKEKECEDAEEESYKLLVVGALGAAIRELERTAQEVPVQKLEE